MSNTRQITIRVQSELMAAADAYCAEVGVTFNGLAAVALSDFLRLRRRRKPSPIPAASKPRGAPLRVSLPSGADRNKPCPCGSGRKWKKCCGNPLAVVPT